MKRSPLWRVSVSTSAEAESAVSELLERELNAQAVGLTDLESGETIITAYLERRPNWEKIKGRLREGLAQARRYGIDTAPQRVTLRRLRREDWAESWKHHFKPLEPHTTLLVKPSWSRKQPKPGQALIVLDPGLSFGTGQHPTTFFCLQQIAEARVTSESQSLLDIGTGSGILAISAAKLGYGPVHAFDFDPEAVRVAKANARANGVARAVRPEIQDVIRMPIRGRRYTVVCANLISNLLIAQQRRICNRVAENGLLILAGILKEEFTAVRRCYENAGFVLRSSRAESEWQSGSFVRAGK